MSFFDLIRDLRKGEPNFQKATKAMKILGTLSIFGALWNFVFPYIFSFEDNFFNLFDLPEFYPFIVLIVFTVIGLLFLLAAKGIKQEEKWGVYLGQIAIIFLSGSIIFFIRQFFSHNGSFFTDLANNPIIFLFIIIFSAQFLIPAFYGIRYLGRLPVKSVGSPQMTYSFEQKSKEHIYSKNKNNKQEKVNYKDAILPFGVIGTFMILMGGVFIVIFIVIKTFGIEFMPFVFIPGFIIMFFGPVVYNNYSSPFEKGRKKLGSFTGGGSIFLFNSTWPFFKLFIYNDAIEIRVAFHRFLIPYDKMENAPELVGLFKNMILVKSNLPGVPSNIRYSSFGSKSVLDAIIKARHEYFNIETTDI